MAVRQPKGVLEHLKAPPLAIGHQAPHAILQRRQACKIQLSVVGLAVEVDGCVTVQ
jgi:hypothetical protein